MDEKNFFAKIGFNICSPFESSLEPENTDWPERPEVFPEQVTPVEAAMFSRLDQTGHSPGSACRTLNYWCQKGEIRSTKFARHVWYLKREFEKFLDKKTRDREQ